MKVAFMEESSASIRASNLEAVMSIEPEGEENMPGVGVGCTRSEQEGEDDALGILKLFRESEEIPSPVNMFQLGEPLF